MTVLTALMMWDASGSAGTLIVSSRMNRRRSSSRHCLIVEARVCLSLHDSFWQHGKSCQASSHAVKSAAVAEERSIGRSTATVLADCGTSCWLADSVVARAGCGATAAVFRADRGFLPSAPPVGKKPPSVVLGAPSGRRSRWP